MAGKYQCQFCGAIVDFNSESMRQMAKRESGVKYAMFYGSSTFEQGVLNRLGNCSSASGNHMWKKIN